MSRTNGVVDIARKVRRRLALRSAARELAKTDKPLGSGRFDVIVYFADTSENLYQLTQWLEVLRVIDQTHPVVIITRSADAALSLRRNVNNPFPVVQASRHLDIDPIIDGHDPKIAFYVNHHRGNFAMLWHPTLLHVYLGHGESDKLGISASNQFKAYDFAFVAGQAAVDRVKRRLINYDADQRLIEVGMPQIDAPQPAAPRALRATRSPQTVLYAPSWEGDREANSYGSLRSHGLAMVRALIADDRYRIIFRPHPLSGHRERSYGQARDAVAALVSDAAKQHPETGHLVDVGTDFGWQLAEGDVCIADVSAVALNAVAADKPVVVTKPSSGLAIVSDSSVMSRFDLLPADQAGEIAQWLTSAASGKMSQRIAEIRDYCFGDTSPGAATQRFVAATEQVINLRDSLIRERDANY